MGDVRLSYFKFWLVKSQVNSRVRMSCRMIRHQEATELFFLSYINNNSQCNYDHGN
jgi:hypothetical protein